MTGIGRRAGEATLWVVGLALSAIGVLILWNLASGKAQDSGALPFLFGAVMYGGPGVLLLWAAARTHRRQAC